MNIREIEARYDKAAPLYEHHAALEAEVGKRLLERVTFVRNEPVSIVDLGCGTGQGASMLSHRFSGADVTAIDLSSKMLRQLRENGTGSKRIFQLQADLTRIPMAARSTDLVYSNLALQWAGDFEMAVNEVRRILRPGGLFLFSVPGPGSLRELHSRTAHGGSMTIPIYMPDLQDLGDLLVSAGFTEPVMDAEVITLNYPSAQKMDQELAITGGAGFAELPLDGLESEAFPLSFEIVYGLAFGPPEGQPVRTSEGEVATFSVDQLKRNRPV